MICFLFPRVKLFVISSERNKKLYLMETKINGLPKRGTNVLCNEGFSDVNITFETGAKKGDGVFGEISHAKISAVKEGIPQEFNVVIKCAPSGEITRKTMPVRNLFLREIFYYTKVIPIYNNLQDKSELCVAEEMRCIFPKCYGLCDHLREEMIILEDLTKKDFLVAPLQSLDYDHATVMVQTVAKLHALSFIYEERYPKRFKEIVEQCAIKIYDIPNPEFDEKYFNQHGEKTMVQFKSAIKDLSLRKRFETVAGINAHEKHKEFTEAGKIKVILHGDNWHNNHMFRYKNNKPEKGIPIDFQWSIYGSVAYDFMYMFFSSSRDLRRKNFHQLVDEYYSELKRFLAIYGYSVNKFCTYEQLKEEVKSLGLLFPVIYMITSPIFKYPELTLEEIVSHSEAYAVTDEYRESVNDIVTDLADLGFF